MKSRALLGIALCLAPGASAGPRTWKEVLKDPRVWVVAGVSMASSIAATIEINHCRKRPNAGIAFCDGGYGEYKAREWVRNVGQAGMVAFSMYGRKQGYPEWFVPALAFAGYNISVAVRQSELGCKAGFEPVYGTKYNCQPSNYDEWGDDQARRLTRLPTFKF